MADSKDKDIQEDLLNKIANLLAQSNKINKSLEHTIAAPVKSIGLLVNKIVLLTIGNHYFNWCYPVPR